MTVLRSTLPPLLRLMLDLPVDERGYPVPFFVAWYKPTRTHENAHNGISLT
jgi:hypothetical protein